MNRIPKNTQDRIEKTVRRFPECTVQHVMITLNVSYQDIRNHPNVRIVGKRVYSNNAK